MATIHDELEFLKGISMDAAQKESLPVSLKSTELGGRTFPLVELIPFVKHIVQVGEKSMVTHSRDTERDCFRYIQYIPIILTFACM